MFSIRQLVSSSFSVARTLPTQSLLYRTLASCHPLPHDYDRLYPCRDLCISPSGEARNSKMPVTTKAAPAPATILTQVFKSEASLNLIYPNKSGTLPNYQRLSLDSILVSPLTPVPIRWIANPAGNENSLNDDDSVVVWEMAGSNRNNRHAKKSNHGKRPCSRIRRRKNRRRAGNHRR